jgi:RimJ/RimL family protein N-acetyltransferase
MKFKEVILEGKIVRLEPLALKHKEELCAAISDGELWKLYVTLVPHPDNIESFFQQAQANFESGDGITFAIIEKQSNKVVGSTRFMKANLPNKKVEIGYSFLGKSWQKTQVNTECKFLLLTYAFETLHLNRVEFITDYLNNASRNAILRLGAKEEGIMRSHMVMPNGRVRDSVLYSIVRHEWDGIREHLLFKLNQE